MTDQPTEPNMTAPTSANRRRPRRRPRASAARPVGLRSMTHRRAGNPHRRSPFGSTTAVRSKAQEVAEKEGLNVSQLGRKALKEYLSKH
ncbi:MAG: hypothetical protein WKF73_09115 [Nocardioidaceae bacterium]